MSEPDFASQLKALNARVAALAKEKSFIRSALLRTRSRFLVAGVAAELIEREGLSVKGVSQQIDIPEKRFREWLTGSASFEPTIGFLVDLSMVCCRTFELELIPFPALRPPSSRKVEKEPAQLEPIALITVIRGKFHLYRRDRDPSQSIVEQVDSAVSAIFAQASLEIPLWELSDIAEKNESFLRLKFLPLQARMPAASRISHSQQKDLQPATGFWLDKLKTT